MKTNPIVSVHMKGIKLCVVIGTRSEERAAAQEILADLVFEYDASLAAQTDALADALDYADMHARILHAVAPTSFLLLERLAGFILNLVMQDGRVLQATLILEKTGALAGSKAVALTMTTQRTGLSTIDRRRCC